MLGHWHSAAEHLMAVSIVAETAMSCPALCQQCCHEVGRLIELDATARRTLAGQNLKSALRSAAGRLAANAMGARRAAADVLSSLKKKKSRKAAKKRKVSVISSVVPSTDEACTSRETCHNDQQAASRNVTKEAVRHTAVNAGPQRRPQTRRQAKPHSSAPLSRPITNSLSTVADALAMFGAA